MKTYEALIIFPLQAGSDLFQEGKSPFEEALKKHEGKIVSRSELGKRLLGYSVKKANEGYLVCFTFELLPSQMESLRRALQIAEGILKFTIIHKPKSKIELTRPSNPTQTHAVHTGERR